MELLVTSLLLAVVVLGALHRSLTTRVTMLQRRIELAEAHVLQLLRAQPSTRAADPVEPVALVQAATPPIRNEARDAASTEAARPAPATTPRVATAGRIRTLFAENALAVVGGVFVLVSAVFFVGYAVDQGWIGPELRIALAAAFGVCISTVGVLQSRQLPRDERIGSAIGSLHGVLTGVGAAVVYLAIVSAVRIELVLQAPAGILAALLVGAVTVLVARMWRSQDLAAFGIIAALASPILLDAPASGSTIVFVAIALVGAVIVAVVDSWPRLLASAALVTMPQLLAWSGDAAPGWATALAVAIAWWALLAGGSILQALRSDEQPRHSIVALLLAMPVVVGQALALALDAGGSDSSDHSQRIAVGLALLGALNIVAAYVAHLRRTSSSLALTVTLAGAGATSISFAISQSADGPVQAVAWSAEAAVMALVWWVTRSKLAGAFAVAATLVTALEMLVRDAPIALLLDPATTFPGEAVAGVAAPLVASCIALAILPFATRSTTLRPDEQHLVAVRSLHAVIATLAWYGVAIVIASSLSHEWFALGIAIWASTAMLVAAIAVATEERMELVGLGMAAFLTAMFAYAFGAHSTMAMLLTTTLATLSFVATAAAHRPSAHGLWWYFAGITAHVLFVVSAALALLPLGVLLEWNGTTIVRTLAILGLLAASAGPAAWIAWRLDRARTPGLRIASIVALYGVSVFVVALTSRSSGEVEQLPQVSLTLTWTALGVATLFAAARPRLRHVAEVRIGAFALLGLAGAKLVLIDTANLETPARVVAFLASGLGLLGASWLEQRLRRIDRDS